MTHPFLLFFSIIFFFLPAQLIGQSSFYPSERIRVLDSIISSENEKSIAKTYAARQFASKFNIPQKRQLADGRIIELQYIHENELPIYHITHNAGASETVSAKNIYPGSDFGVDITGEGLVAGVWDAGSVYPFHIELANRIISKDFLAPLDDHATHVAGTISASGIDSDARGIAYKAGLYSYDWNNYLSELALEASNGLLVSNHSYGIVLGWNWEDGKWVWRGLSEFNQDYRFGYYSENQSRVLDEIAYNAPHFLMVWSAGNDRNDFGNGTKLPDGPYDCIGPEAISKNVLAVGSVEKIEGGYTQPSDVRMTAYSSWGPSDDGRIKPDIVAPGHQIYSTIATGGGYGTKSGTSMAAPVVSGSLLLLQQLHNKLFGSYLRAASLKGLIIHTAHPAGASKGPDFEYGWGLLNTEGAARVILRKDNFNNHIRELTLGNNNTYELDFYADGTKSITATLSWTDPPGTPPPQIINPPDLMLVNDLDMVITDEAGNNYYPFITEPGQTNGNNFRDNVEKIIIENPEPQKYTLKVSHKGSLSGGSQDFSIILTTTALELDGDPVFFWIGGEGSWDNPENWSFTSGGPSAGEIPGNNSHVIFDDNSFTSDLQTITLNASANLKSFSYLSKKEANLRMNNYNIGISRILLVSSLPGFNQMDGIFRITGEETKISLISQKPYSIEIDNQSGVAEFLSNANLDKLILNKGSMIMRDGIFKIREILTWGDQVKTLDFSKSKLYIQGVWDLADENLTVLFDGSELITEKEEEEEPSEVLGGTIDFNSISILSGKLIIDAAVDAESIHNKGELSLLQSSFTERLSLDPGSKLIIGGGESLEINELQISSNQDNFVFFQSSLAASANIHYDKYLKVCFDYLNIDNVTVSGQSTVVAGLGSILSGVTSGWIDMACQDALFVDFEVRFACERARTEFVDKSTGQITQWLWNFGNTADSEGSSTIRNPFYTYQSAGTYPVSLEIFDNTSQKAYTKNIEIKTNHFTTNEIVISGDVYTSVQTAINYQWFLDGIPIADATSRSFRNSSNLKGEFQVLISDTTCNLMSEPLVVSVNNPTGEHHHFLVYPNPFESSVTIEYYSGYTGAVTYQFYDVWGRVVSKGWINKYNNQLIINEDMSHFPPGIYLVRLHAGNDITSRKLVKPF
jgi:hypothetical protein